jgi:hypothetical protein
MCAEKIKITDTSSRLPQLSAEFSAAGTGTRIIRSAFIKLLKNSGAQYHAARLTAKMVKVVQSDPIHRWGERTVANGDLTLLEGFDFSKKQLAQTLPITINADINRETGVCVVHLPQFIPQEEIMMTGSHTHVMFVAAAAEVNFERESFTTKIVKSDCLDMKKPVSITLQTTLPKASKQPILLAFGLQVYYVINGHAHGMGNREVSSLCIVKVENAPAPPTKKKSSK